MRTGSTGSRGYSYLAVLFLVALTAAGLAALGQAWSTAAQRERERELLFRGGEIARAIAAYAKTTPPPEQYPKSLDDLLADKRGVSERHHLRRAYVDPFTGEADWELVPEPGQPGAFSAVRSRSEHPLLRELGPDGVQVKLARDLLFAARAYANNPRPQADPASAASAALAASR